MAFFKSVLEIQRKNLQYKINEINKLLNQEHKNIVFIGTIGVGKTSAICSLFNLFDTSDNRKRPILKTGSGATTICEVEIEFDNSYEIKIEPYTIAELKQLISEYVDTIIGNNVLIDGEKQQLTTELERAIKYMIAPETMPLIKIDSYINDIIQKHQNNRNLILDYFFNAASVDNRTQVEFTNPDGQNNSAWLRKIFSDINDGLNKNASIPKKFYIKIPSSNNYKNKIIDTKGIDSKNQNNKEFLREDLDRYIKNPDNLIVYCSSFPAAPDSDIMQSIYYYTQKDPEIYKRMILLIIPMHNQPEDVAGVVQNLDIHEYKQGLEIRKATVSAQIIGQLKNDIYTLSHNSSLSDSRIEFNDNVEEIFTYQNQFIENLKKEKIILTGELNNLIEDILTPEQVALEQQIINNISNLKVDLNNLVLNPYGFIQQYAQRYRLQYAAANTKHAIHVRYGIFNTKNVFFDFEVHIEEIVTSFFNQSNILAILQRELGISQQIIQTIIPAIHENFQNKVVELTATLTSQLRSYFYNNAYNHNFWQPLIARWGLGPGYNVNVQTLLVQQMDDLNIQNEISLQFTSAWENLVSDFINDLN